MATTIWLVRHGDYLNPKKVLAGRLAGFPLSEEGRRQTEAAAQFLAHKKIAAIYSSPQLRALETAEIIRALHPELKLHKSENLNEVRTPCEGWKLQRLIRAHWAPIFAHTDPAYESPEDVLRRTLRFVTRIRRQFPGQVVAVTHGDVIAFLRQWKRREDPDPAANQAVYPLPATVHRFTFRTDDPRERPSYKLYKPYECG